MKHPNIIFCGDVNVAHTEIDIARPKENENHVGFLPIERAWMDKLIKHGWIDVFRHFNPDKKDGNGIRISPANESPAIKRRTTTKPIAAK